MAIKGCLGVVKFGTNAVAEVKSFNIEESGTETDTSILGNCQTQSEVTSVTTNVSIEVFYAPGDAAQTAMVVGAKAAIELYPEGEVATKNYLSSTEAVVLSRSMEVTHGDMLSRSLTLKCNEALTSGTVSS